MRILLSTYLLATLFGCDQTQSPRMENTPPIVVAAKRGDLDEVKRLVAIDKSVINAEDSKGGTAASSAILNDHIEIAKYLIDIGYPLNPPNEANFPLIMACLSRYSRNSEAMLKFLLEKGADPNITYKPQRWIALNMAVNNGQEDNVRLLVQHGAKLNSKDGTGQTPLELATERLARFKDPRFKDPHEKSMDPKVRQQAVDKWERMVRLLKELEASKQ